MAYIGHRCACGHLDVHHRADSASREHCEAVGGVRCGKGCRKSSTSILVPTFDLAGRRIETITEPGQWIGEGAGYSRAACACDDCRALHAELTGAAA
ncbi:hypothetical protein [Kitasatospora cheerisanensis]|uniref:Uncharacterized protein n=1 Tax=Kitasatospora cheerisanensis KCTC 2395 TaxID=1348663 RepID=A0A066YZU1_9ACTN|nr:hypothetical protein [Kitasatospora cheerisanensis]KDN83450.1 hypothetical protein KCH_49320 [Kitasatospora cheerisanensis KCTC 2395]